MKKIDQELKFYIILASYAIIIVVITMAIVFASNNFGVVVKLLWIFALFGLCWGAEDIVGFFVPKHKYNESIIVLK